MVHCFGVIWVLLPDGAVSCYDPRIVSDAATMWPERRKEGVLSGGSCTRARPSVQ